MSDITHRASWFMALAIFLAGCSTQPAPPSPRASWEPPLLKKEIAAKANEVNPRQVSAYAHYAQAMIYDMDDKPELALGELSKAALDDPSNVDLVLELTRRYLQQKQPEQALEI